MLLISFILGLGYGFAILFNDSAIQKAYKYNQEKNLELAKEYSVGYLDFPLIDIDFSKDDDWLIVDRNSWTTKNACLRIIEDCSEFDKIKQQLLVRTFISGRGTTPEGAICVYKNDELVKQIPYVSIVYEGQTLTRKFVTVSEKTIECIVDVELVPLF